MHAGRIILVSIIAWIVATLLFGHDPFSLVIIWAVIATTSIVSYFLGYSAARNKNTASTASNAGRDDDAIEP